MNVIIVNNFNVITLVFLFYIISFFLSKFVTIDAANRVQQVSFDHDLKPVIKVKSGSKYSKGIYKDNQQNALKIYNQLKIEVKSLLEDEFEIKF